MESNIKLPEFVKLNNTALRLTGDVYYRDGGKRSISYKIIDGVLLSWKSTILHLQRKPLIEITKEEWKKENGEYAPNI